MPKNLSDFVKKGLPVGRYTVKILEVERTSAKNGNPQLQFKAEAESGQTGLWWRPLTVKGLGFIAGDVVAIGRELALSDDRGNWPDEIADFVEQTFVDLDVDVEVADRGDGRTEVRIVGLPGQNGGNF